MLVSITRQRTFDHLSQGPRNWSAGSPSSYPSTVKKKQKEESTRPSVTSGIGTRPSMTNRTPTVGAGAASSGACGPPSAWPVLRRLPWPRRFLATTIRGPEPGAHVLEPLPLTRILGSPPDVSLRSLLSFFVFLYLSIFLSVKPRSYGHFPSPTPSMSPRGIFNKTHLLSRGLSNTGTNQRLSHCWREVGGQRAFY